MKISIWCNLILLLLLSWEPPYIRAQNPQSVPNSEAITITFPCGAGTNQCAAQQGADNRYYIHVPTSILPQIDWGKSGATVEVKIAKDPSNEGNTIYSFPFRAGTAPLLSWLNAGLKVSFIPPEAPVKRQEQDLFPANVVPPIPISTGTPAAVPGTIARVNNSPSPPATQTATASPAPENTANLDLSIPESPAFAILGVTPQTVLRPSSPRSFATSILNGVDQNGNFQSGIAFDLSPYLLLAGPNLRLREYQASYAKRLLARTQVSFATTKGVNEEDKSLRLALGFHATLWDRGDFRMDKELMKCFQRAIKLPDILPPFPVDPPGTGASEVEKKRYETYLAAQKKYDEENARVGTLNNTRSAQCRAEARKRNWNKSSWVIAAAPSWLSTDGQTKNFDWNGGGVWTSVAYGFEGTRLAETSQLILHARYRNQEMVPDPKKKGSFINQDSYFFGGRARVGNENTAFSFEGTLIRARLQGLHFDNSARLSLGLERKVAENLWLNLAFGGESGRSDGKNKGFVLTSLKWGFGEKQNTQGQ